MNDFARIFAAAFTGGLIYKLIVYFIDPYEIDISAELLQLVLIAGVITLLLVIIKRFQKRNKD